MAFWQENYAFIKDVYNTRANGLAELMTKTNNAMAEVLADKIYSSTDFKRIKENFSVRNFVWILDLKGPII